MSLAKGRINVICTTHPSIKAPELQRVVEVLNSRLFQPKSQAEIETSNFGFCNWQNYSLQPDVQNTSVGDWFMFGVRYDYRDIPKLVFDTQLKLLRRDCPSTPDATLKEELRNDLIVNYAFQPSLVMAAWNPVLGIFLCEGGGTVNKWLWDILASTFGLPINPPNVKPAEEILKQLWDTGKIEAKNQDDTPCCLLIDDSVTIGDDEHKCSIRGLDGNTTQKAQDLLDAGMAIQKAKLLFAIGAVTSYSFSLSVDQALPSGFSVESDQIGLQRLMDRLDQTATVLFSWLHIFRR